MSSKLPDQLIFLSGLSFLAFVNPFTLQGSGSTHHYPKSGLVASFTVVAVSKDSFSTDSAVEVFTLARGPHRVLSVRANWTRFFNEVVIPPPHPFQTWLGTGFGGFWLFILFGKFFMFTKLDTKWNLGSWLQKLGFGKTESENWHSGKGSLGKMSIQECRFGKLDG